MDSTSTWNTKLLEKHNKQPKPILFKSSSYKKQSNTFC